MQILLKNRIEIDYREFFSRINRRKLSYGVLAPSGDSIIEKGNILYLLHGLFGSYDNWLNSTNLSVYLEKFDFPVVCVTGENSWYVDCEENRNFFESYFVEELIPEVENLFVGNGNNIQRSIAGISMGGYGAFKFGLKYPEMFALVGSFSGALQAATLTDKQLGNGWKALTDSIMSVYGSDDSSTRKLNDVLGLVRATPNEKNKNLPFIYLDCGTEDGLIGINREFSNILLDKKIPHEFRQLPGKHDWNYWDSQIQEFLRISNKL